jgi:hypothetical protein
MKPARLVIAAAQMKFRAAIADNVSWIAEAIHSSAKAGADVILFPECAPRTGLPAGSLEGNADCLQTPTPATLRQTMTPSVQRTTCQLLVGIGLLTAVSRSSAGAPRITLDQDTVRSVSEHLDARVSLRQPAFVSLGVDSLGLNEWGANSMRPPAPVFPPFLMRCETNPALALEYSHSDQTTAHPAGWRIEVAERRIALLSRWSEAEKPEALVLEFDPHRCHVTLLGLFNEDGSIRLPAVLHFPDQGSFRVTADGGGDSALGYDARRAGEGFIKVTFPSATPARPRIEYRWEVAAIHPKSSHARGLCERRLSGPGGQWHEQ